MRREIFRIENGIKEIDGNQLLSGIYLQAYQGEILGVISDNMSEKQCLVEVLSGHVNLDYGDIYIQDKKVNDYEKASDLKSLIGVIERKSKLIENLTVAENIFVIRGGAKKYFLKKSVLYRQAQHLIDEFGLTIQADAYVRDLTILEKTIVELLKAYIIGRKLIVLNDITTFLSSEEEDYFIGLVIALKGQGIDFIIIENFDGLLFKYSKQIIVIHKGKTVRILDNKNQDKKLIYSLLLGAEYSTDSKRIQLDLEKKSSPKDCVLELVQLSTELLSEVSLRLYKGETLSLLYHEHESWQQLLKVLQGEEHFYSGKMQLLGKTYKPKGMWDAIHQGICFIEENPIEKMLFYDMSVLDNLCLTMGNKVKGMWMQKKYRRNIINHMEAFFDETFFLTPLSQLETTSLQKLAYGKWLLYLPKVIICHKPFSTTDVHMRRVTQQMIEAYMDRGIAVLIVTSNISEAHMMGNKVVYLKEGKLLEK